jgi:hypothetical protein
VGEIANGHRVTGPGIDGKGHANSDSRRDGTFSTQPTMTTTPNTSPIALVGDGYAIAITLAAEVSKDKLLTCSKAVAAVENTDDQAIAHAALKRLAEFRNLLEKSRTEVKAPVLRIGKDIDSKAAEFSKETDAEERRIKGLLSCFAVKQDAERRAREAEARKVKEEADRQRRIADEAQRKAAAEDASLKEAATATKQAVAAEAAAEVAEVKAVAILAEAPAPVKMQLDYTVTDIAALYAARPGLVELTPKRREILAALESGRAADADFNLPGLTIREVPKISTR